MKPFGKIHKNSPNPYKSLPNPLTSRQVLVVFKRFDKNRTTRVL